MFTFTFFVCNYYRSSLSLVLSQSIARINIYLFHLFSCFFYFLTCVFFVFIFLCVFFCFFSLNLPYAQIKSLFLLIFSFFLALFLSLLSDFLSLLFCKLFPQVINNKSYTIIIIINNETNVLPMVPA